MKRIDVLLTSEPADGSAPFAHGDLEVLFHRWSRTSQLPLIEGALWAFVDLVLPDISGLEVCRRLRVDPLTAQAHVTMVLDEHDPDQLQHVIAALATAATAGPSLRGV